MRSTKPLSLFDVGPDGDAEPPLEVYAAQVQSLFSNVGPLAVALACAAFVGAVACWRSGLWLLGVVTSILIVAAIYRVALFRLYRARQPTLEDGRAAFKAWERLFGAGAVITAAGFAAMSLTVFVLSDDPLSQLLVDATSIGYTAGSIGRNFTRRRLALWQVGLPMGSVAIGAVWHGGFEYYTLAGFTLLYWLAASDITNNLARGGQRLLMLVSDNTRLADRLTQQNRRLDAALTNMSHGLCMIDETNRLVFGNRRMSELFGLPETALRPGVRLAELLSAAAPGRRADPEAVARLIDDLTRADEGRCDAHLLLEDGSLISWSENPAAEGGAVVIFEDVTERERARAHADHLSTHDSLTGLPNRFKFEKLLRGAVQHAQLHGARFAVLFVDLDRFKFVNDTLGHAAGDKLLLETAARLKAKLGVLDVVARLGGDEFVAILQNLADGAEALARAQAIADALCAQCSIDGHELAVSASIGLAMFPDDAKDEKTLLKCADAAMYHVKQDGKNGVRRFSLDIAAPSVQRLEMENGLRHALERGEFELYYQPRLAVGTRAVTGAEALLRWRHPEFGLLAPNRFIDVAEETGFILSIGRWAIETACRQTEQWRQMGLADMRVAVNLSPRQFADATLLPLIEGALNACATPAELFEIEITESVAMRDAARSEAIIRAIRSLGVRVSIDDFGAGHSSMARLKHLSIDAIKIDRAFVSGLAVDARDRAIVEAICALGKALRLSIVGEGVETDEQAALLTELRCDEMQGYLFARPMPAEDIPAFVHKHSLAQLARANSAMREKAGATRSHGVRENRITG